MERKKEAATFALFLHRCSTPEYKAKKIRLKTVILTMPSCTVCSVYVRICAFTIAIRTCLPPADRHIAAGVS